jgi:hypothetical protein
MKKGWRVRIVASYDDEKMEGEPKLIATNRLDWDAKTILKTYLKRWKIDSFYRGCQARAGPGGLRAKEDARLETPLAHGLHRRCPPTVQL